MSSSADSAITRARDEGNGSLSPPREGSLESTGIHSDDAVESTENSQDSGLAFNFSDGFKNSLGKPPPAPIPGGLNFGYRRSSLQTNSSTPLSDLRRPSIVDIVNNGALCIGESGEYEINFGNVNATELEQLYAEQRRGSISDANMENASESWMQSTTDGLSENLSALVHSNKYRCPNNLKHWIPKLPKFNSKLLEKHFKMTVIDFLRHRFRTALGFIALFTVLWIVMFSAITPFSPTNATNGTSIITLNDNLAIYSVRYEWVYVIGGVVLFVCTCGLFLVTCTKCYAKLARSLSLVFSLILMCCSFALAISQVLVTGDMGGTLTLSFMGQFAITAVFILVLFTLSRLPIWLSVVMSVLYLVILEGILGYSSYTRTQSFGYSGKIVIGSTVGRILLYVGLVFSGMTTSYLLRVRQLVTFWKVAQCVSSQNTTEWHRILKCKVIRSIMPDPFATQLMNLEVQMMFMMMQNQRVPSFSLNYFLSRDNVSILFADIVDFTKFSSTLSASDLVGILNDVFCMFDDFVDKHNCEKVSTLGDCYFCVSGCPEPEPQHADNCVNMGLAIIDSLEKYRVRKPWPIKMRVGIHTGSVFCGVMGTVRFKFDVWSRDVRIANMVESVSTPGRVLISQSTYACLSQSYITERVTLQKVEPMLAHMALYYVSVKKPRVQPRPQGGGATGLSGSEWKRRLNAIDTVCKVDEAEEEEKLNDRRESVNSIKSVASSLLCPRRSPAKDSTPPRKTLGDQESTSIMDIRARLQRCTSYADLSMHQHEESLDVVSYMEKNSVDFETYFDHKLHPITLSFHDKDIENAYKRYGQNLDDGYHGELTETELGHKITTLSYMLDTMALFVNFLVIMIGSAVCLNADGTFSQVWQYWLIILVVGLIVEAVFLVSVFAVFWLPKCFTAILINYHLRTAIGLIFIFYPMTMVSVTISKCQGSNDPEAHLARLSQIQMSFFITIVVIVSSITFMEVSHLIKAFLGLIVSMLVVGLVLVLNLTICSVSDSFPVNITATSTPPTRATENFEGDPRTPPTDSPLATYFSAYYTRHVAPEAIVLVLLVLILIVIVNRMAEVSDRLSFIGRLQASSERRLVKQRAAQTDWLLFNILPQHVESKLQSDRKYSQDHECVGVMFASIVNFQQFLHKEGEDSLILLNSIISEFDRLLALEQFSCVEKIKTIGSIYMAASGLRNSPGEADSVIHLLKLIEFGHRLVDTLKMKNRKFNGFIFEMQIGFNCGPVTSGVVGNRKMLYDIWGDTVNVASRMSTTGSINEIQMPLKCLEKLGPFVKTNTVHKVVNIKGKGEMRTVSIRYPCPTTTKAENLPEPPVPNPLAHGQGK